MTVITGTAGNDRLNGTIGDDVIEGLAGSDTLIGAAGDDVLRGGADGDTLEGQVGNDTIEGGTGIDFLVGGAGDDLLLGGADGDFLYDESGSDSLYGEGGDDTIYIYRKHDTAIAPAALSLSGGDGNDRISLEFYNQDMVEVDGGSGSDTITLSALHGSARLALGAGSDVLRLAPFFSLGSNTQIVLTDFEPGAAGDRIDFDEFLVSGLSNRDQASNPFATGHLELVQSGANVLLKLDRDGSGERFGSITLLTFQNTDAAALTFENFDGYPPDGTVPPGQSFTGTVDNDTLTGTIGDDVIEGLGGSDTLNGAAGEDLLRGGADNDTLRGDAGNDTLEGGAGFDSLDGGSGDDLVLGGTGNDQISDARGSDLLYGEDGDDTISVDRHLLAATATAIVVATPFLSGGDGNDHFNISFTNHDVLTIDGGSGADTVTLFALNSLGRIAMGADSDVLRLHQYYNITPNSSILLTDFEPGAAGDRIDFSEFLGWALSNWDHAANPFETGHLELVQSGPDTLLRIDRDGFADGFGLVTLLTFQNAAAASFTAENFDGYPPDGSVPPGQTVNGTAGGDILTGTTGDDVLEGFEGSDTLKGAAGNDILRGGADLDVLHGELGDDILEGGAGTDSLSGGRGDDRLFGGAGDDFLYDESGSDSLYGEHGNDWFTILRSNFERQTIIDNLYLDGGDGDDSFHIDILRQDTVTVSGGPGVDSVSIVGLNGTANVELGAGSDFFRLNKVLDLGPNTRIVLMDFEVGAAGDRIEFSSFLAETLSNWDQISNPFSTGHLKLVQSGTGALLKIDRDGSGSASDFVTLFTFQNVNAANFTAENFEGYSGLTVGSTSGADLLTGTSSGDIVSGGEGGDVFRLEQGGDDAASGGAGADGFYFGGAFTSGDAVDGGEGSDQVGLQGDYAALALGAQSLVGIETLALLSGTDTRFGALGTDRFSYALTTVDGNVAAGAVLKVNFNALVAGENVTFDGSAEQDGSLFLFAGKGVDDLTGGAQGDAFYFGPDGAFTTADRVDGGGGFDQVALRGNYSVALTGDEFANVETLALLSGKDTRFGAAAPDNNYVVAFADGNVAAGVQFVVNVQTLRAGESVAFDGSAESDGSFRFVGGAGDDSFTGSANADTIFGAGGADTLTGGAGADLFRYRSASESTLGAADIITDFVSGSDRIDLSLIDADTGAAGDQAFAFIGEAAFSGAAGELRVVQSAGGWTIEGDVDGDSAADLVIMLTSPPPVAGDFAL